MCPKTKEKTEQKTKTSILDEDEAQLIVLNDDFNTFDYVIMCFVEVCKHTIDDASRLALIIHHIGSSVVKTGEFEVMKKMKEKLVERGLSAIVQRGNLN